MPTKKMQIRRSRFNCSRPNAPLIANAARTHWSTENSLHWVLDVSFREDASRIRKDNSPESMAILRHFALNLLSRNKASKCSMRAKRNKAAWDLAYLNHLISRNCSTSENQQKTVFTQLINY